MKHSELQKQIENLGLIARDRMEYLCVLNEEGDYLATVSNKVMYKMEMISFDEHPELMESGKDKDVFNLLVEYAKTPLNERYTPKKYIVIASRKKEGYLEEVLHNSEKIEIYCRLKAEKECLFTRDLRFKLENLEDNKERLLASDLWTMPLIRLWGLEKYERIEFE